MCTSFYIVYFRDENSMREIYGDSGSELSGASER